MRVPASWAVMAAACVSLLAFGVLGVGRGDVPRFDDVRYFQVAAELMLQGVNPYLFEAFQGATREFGLGDRIGVFPYPPHGLAVWLPLAAVPFEVGRWLWTLGNVAVLAGIALGMARWYVARAHAAGDPHALSTGVLIAAVIIGNPFSAHLVWTGQTGLFIVGSLLLGWKYAHAGRPVLAGVFLFVASIKPQISALALLWLLLNGHARAVAVAALFGAASLALSMAMIGPNAVAQWFTNALTYQTSLTNSLAYNANLASLLAGWGVPLDGTLRALLPVLAVGYVVALTLLHRRRPLDRLVVLAALLAASLFLVFGRDYDMATMAPLVPTLWWHSRRSLMHKALGLAILALLFVPQRLVSQLGSTELRYWKIVLLGVLLAWITTVVLRARTDTLGPAT